MQRVRMRRKRNGLLAIVLLFCLFVLGLGATSGTAMPVRAAAPHAAALTVSPATIAPGKAVEVTGSGFRPGEQVLLQLGALSASGTVASYRGLLYATAAANGDFRLAVTIPGTTATGTYSLRALGVTSHIQSVARLSVVAPHVTPPAPAPALSVNLASVAAGKAVVVTGSHFQPNEVVAIQLGLVSAGAVQGYHTLFSARASGNGSFRADVTVPAGTAAGSYFVRAEGLSSHRLGYARLTVTAPHVTPPAPAPVLTVNLASVAAGKDVDVTGSHFQPGEQVLLQLGALTASGTVASYQGLQYARAAASGGFRIALKIPATTATGAYSLRALGVTSHRQAYAHLSVVAPHVTPPAPAPVLTVNLASVAAGKAVVVTGSHFQPNEVVAIQLGLVSAGAVQGYHTLFSARASGNGSFRADVTVPAGTAAGSYFVRAEGLSSHRLGYARLTVTAPHVVPAKASVTISPTSISPGETLHVVGKGFHPQEVVTITLSASSGSSAIMLGQARANAAGNFTIGIRVPFGVTPGQQLVVLTGRSSNRQVATTVRVVVPAAALSVSPRTVKPHESITVTGAHFQPGESIAIDMVTLTGSVQLGTARAQAGGGFVVRGLTVPASAPQGTVTIVATGASSHLSATARLQIAALSVTLTVSTGTVTPGQSITVAGHGFIPGEAISVSLASAMVRVTLATAVANTAGAFSASYVVIPSFLPAGAYTISAAGQRSGRTASRSLAVQVRQPAAPRLSITGATPIAGAYQANPGGLLQVAGSGFPARVVVALVLVGPRTVTLTSAATSSAGILGPLGVTVPATSPAGTYRLEALVAGRALATTAIRVVQLAPQITVSSGRLTIGIVITVSGSGFAPHEQVVIALNGLALPTTPSILITNAAGQFSASFTVPQSVTTGANVLAATGATSRATAAASVSSSPPVASRWYFVNGDTTNGRTTTISILNPGNAVTTAKMTFLYQAGPEQTYTRVVPAHALSVVDLGPVAGTGRIVSTILEANHPVSAASMVSYPGGDSTMTPGAAGPATRWYLAEGYTNGGFSETIHVMNPNSSYATVDAQFLPFNGKPTRETRFVMLPHSTIQIDAGLYMPSQSISAIVSADKPIVVERSMHFGLGGRGAHDKIGATSLSTVWYFAQGASAADRQTFFTVLNPNPATPAAVTATFFNSVGQPVGARTIVVNPLRRGNIKLNDVLPNAQVATIVTSNVPVAVERPEYQGPAHLALAPSGSVTFGRNGGGLSWSFPYGSTLNGNQTSMYLFNPGLQPVQVKATFYAESGAVVSQTLIVAPNSDLSLNAASVPGMPAARFGAVLRSVNGQPFIAEESIQNVAAQTYDSSEGVA